MNINELEELKTACKLKAHNLKTATETLSCTDYSDLWTLQNYLSCVEETAISARTLIDKL